jgi:hypothetical protein
VTHFPQPGANEERQEILDVYNASQLETNSNQTHTKESTQWGRAGIGASMTCDGCVMFSPDEHTNYRDGKCSLGWRTYNGYQCNEWQPAEKEL